MKKETRERLEAMERRIAELEAQVLALKADPYRLYPTVPIPAPAPVWPVYQPSWPNLPFVTCEGGVATGITTNGGVQ